MVEWRAIKGFEGLYQVSNEGKVRSIDRVICRKQGHLVPLKGTELAFTLSKIDAKKHLPRASVQLWKGNKAYLRKVHRLVAEAFIPNPENKPTVNHIDGNPLNNHVDNLGWATQSENQRHAYKLGLIKPVLGRIPTNSKKVRAYNPLTGEEIIEETARALAKRFGVSPGAVCKVCIKNSHLEKPFYRCRGYYCSYINA